MFKAIGHALHCGQAINTASGVRSGVLIRSTSPHQFTRLRVDRLLQTRERPSNAASAPRHGGGRRYRPLPMR
jgi:hypothetical protein